MKLKFIKSQEIDKGVKCTIHESGKMGFSASASNKMNLSTDKSISVALNEDDKTDENLYVLVNDSVQENAFKINRAGKYYYVNTKALFDNIGLNYKEVKIIYDIVDFEHEGTKLFKFLKRERKKKEKTQ